MAMLGSFSTLSAICCVGLIAHSLGTPRCFSQNLVQNGSFETGDFSYWTTSGHVAVRNTAPASDGIYSAQFGYGDSPTDGVVSQTVETVSGQAYRLRFLFGAIDYAGHPQSIHVSVLDNQQVIAQLDLGPLSYGPTYHLEPYSLQFTALGSLTTIQFRDTSANTIAADGVLDAVNVHIVCDVPSCLGDVDHNGKVDLADLALVLSSYGGDGYCVTDLDGDADVDISDLGILLSRYGAACP